MPYLTHCVPLVICKCTALDFGSTERKNAVKTLPTGRKIQRIRNGQKISVFESRPHIQPDTCRGAHSNQLFRAHVSSIMVLLFHYIAEYYLVQNGHFVRLLSFGACCSENFFIITECAVRTHSHPVHTKANACVWTAARMKGEDDAKSRPRNIEEKWHINAIIIINKP